jgi:hypothetical protein
VLGARHGKPGKRPLTLWCQPAACQHALGAMPRPLWQKLAAWALTLALAGGAAALAGTDYEPGSCARDTLGLADRVRLAGASLAGLSLFLIAVLHEGSESVEAFAVAGGSASTAGAIAYTGLALVSSPAELSAVKALALVLFGAVGAASGAFHVYVHVVV